MLASEWTLAKTTEVMAWFLAHLWILWVYVVPLALVLLVVIGTIGLLVLFDIRRWIRFYWKGA